MTIETCATHLRRWILSITNWIACVIASVSIVIGLLCSLAINIHYVVNARHYLCIEQQFNKASFCADRFFAIVYTLLSSNTFSFLSTVSFIISKRLPYLFRKIDCTDAWRVLWNSTFKHPAFQIENRFVQDSRKAGTKMQNHSFEK